MILYQGLPWHGNEIVQSPIEQLSVKHQSFPFKLDGLYFIKYKSVNNLTHAGTGKTVMTTFDNRNIWKNTL